jgi:hypothetical protein
LSKTPLKSIIVDIGWIRRARTTDAYKGLPPAAA